MSSLPTAPEGSGSVSGDPSLPGDLREGYAEAGGQRLHYVEAGEGPLVVLLHGFPEFWYGWRQQIKPLAERVTQLLTDFFTTALPADS